MCTCQTHAQMQLGVKATIVGRNGDRLKSAAKELSDATGQECLPVAADVRKSDALTEAVKQTIQTFGRIDFVICGPFY
jgi:peroxisomal 2,4-dienoyl-CoA reductase